MSRRLFLSLLHSKSPDNKSGFANEKLDELLEQTLSIKISEQERTALYHQIIELAQREKNCTAIVSVYEADIYTRQH